MDDLNKKDWKKAKEILVWIVKLYWKIAPRTLLLVLGIQIAVNLLPIAERRLFSTFLDDLILFFQNDSTAWTKSLIVLLAVAAIFRVGQGVLWSSREILNLKTENKLNKLYLSKISSLDYQQLEDAKTANLIARVNDEYRWRSERVMENLMELMAQTLNLATVLVILAPKYWYLAVILLLGQIPKQLVNRKWIKKGWDNFNKNTGKNRMSWDVHWQLTDKRYLAELKINRAVEFLKEKYKQLIDSVFEEKVDLQKNRIKYDLWTSLLSFSIMGICLVVIAKDIRSGLISIGLFTFYYGIIQRTGDAFSSVFSRGMNISEQISYIGYFKQVMELERKIDNGGKRLKKETAPLIEFRNVSFRYPETKRWVLKDFNLRIEPKEEIALVGANGAGKSTIIKLLCRFYNPDLGGVYIDGKNLKEVKIEDWYQKLGILFQEYNIYQNMSLRDNVSIGKTKKVDERGVLRALKGAQTLALVKQYEKGLETIMSKRYEGEEPSWGQWQKIAIARVLYKKAKALILDEPTASIDATAEAKIFDRIYTENKESTVIIISHRFSTVRRAGRILVIDKGRIIEEGSHDDLIKRGGVYAKSFRLQARGYRDI